MLNKISLSTVTSNFMAVSSRNRHSSTLRGKEKNTVQIGTTEAYEGVSSIAAGGRDSSLTRMTEQTTEHRTDRKKKGRHTRAKSTLRNQVSQRDNFDTSVLLAGKESATRHGRNKSF